MNPTDYRICEYTIAFLPYAHPLHQTKILDTRGVFYSEKTCKQLLDDACIRTGASYQGKREAIKRLLHIQRNLPIPLCWKRNICPIPSTSPDKWDCVWYCYAHVHEVRPHGKKTLLLFTNGEELVLDCSEYSTKQQLQRAARILTHFQLCST